MARNNCPHCDSAYTLCPGHPELRTPQPAEGEGAVDPADWPECSGNPGSCPENEGYGCCKPNSEAVEDQPPHGFIKVRDAIRGVVAVSKVFPGDIIAEEYETRPAAAIARAEAWKQAFMIERQRLYISQGMKIEQARIHAENDAAIAAQQAEGEDRG